MQRCVQTCARNTKEIIAAGADRVSASEKLTKIDPAIAALIDHTILKPEATRADVVKVCREARQYSFASVCVNPYWVPLVRAELAGSPVKVCTVVGFPLGATSTEAKVAETAAALRDGAQEIDMVINVGALRSGDHDAVKRDIQAVVQSGARGRRHRQSDPRNRAARRQSEGRRPAHLQGGGRGFRQDLHRLSAPPAPPRTTSR